MPFLLAHLSFWLTIISLLTASQLYVTGHSLGAALATLFAFEAAAQPDSMIPKPISCFSIASPYVGDESFRDAHLLLENLGKLRHLRVSNQKDIVTIVPKISFRWNVFEQSSHVGYLFKHVGVNLRLFPEKILFPWDPSHFELSFPKIRSGYFSSTLDELKRGWDQSIFQNFSWNITHYLSWPFHSLREYSSRMKVNQDELKGLYLNDIYSKNDVVGHLVPQF